MQTNHTIIIAEAGVNHNGSIEIAKQLIDVAAEAGVDYVKFQTFIPENVISKHAKKADYQIENTGDSEESQLDMVRKLQLNEAQHLELIAHCQKRNIRFFSTAFDLESIDLLEKLQISMYKIPSGEITNLPYLRKIANLKKPVIISTGMANMTEIGEAIKVFEQAGLAKEMITILHCNTEYPTPFEDVNLNAMSSISKEYGIKIGYSDHTLGVEIPIAAVALGASVIEKHFTLSRTMEGPDHRASLEPDELKNMVRMIRNIEKAMGNGIKQPSASETKNIPIARKSIHAVKDLKSGHILTEQDLTTKRPGNGISPMLIDSIIGRVVNKDIQEDVQILWEDLV